MAYKIVDFKQYKETHKKAAKELSDEELFKEVGKQGIEKLNADKRKSMVWNEGAKNFDLFVRYGNKVAYVIEGVTAKNKDDAVAQATTIFERIKIGGQSTAEKQAIKETYKDILTNIRKARSVRDSKAVKK